MFGIYFVCRESKALSELVEDLFHESRYNSRARPGADTGQTIISILTRDQLVLKNECLVAHSSLDTLLFIRYLAAISVCYWFLIDKRCERN